MKVVLATGISGSGRDEYVNSVKEYAENIQNPKNVEVFRVGKMMFEKSERLRRKILPEKILDLSSPHLDSLRAAVFEDILGKIREEKTKRTVDCFIISTHACFRWKKHLTPAFDVHYLNELNPAVYVTIVDDIARVKARLDARLQWKNRLSLKEILIWRDEEIFLTKVLAGYQEKPHFIISRSQGPDVLYDLVFSEKMKKVYLSYPMTHVRKKAELAAQKESLSSALRKDFVVFDPEKFEDTDLRLVGKKIGDKVVASINNMKVECLCQDLEESIPIGLDQTVLRDFRLIDQSDLVIVFWPEEEPGRTPPTVGVVVEAYYGHTNNKHVFAIYPAGENPFMKYCARCFKNQDELFDYLKELKMVKSLTQPIS